MLNACASARMRARVRALAIAAPWAAIVVLLAGAALNVAAELARLQRRPLCALVTYELCPSVLAAQRPNDTSANKGAS